MVSSGGRIFIPEWYRFHPKNVPLIITESTFVNDCAAVGDNKEHLQPAVNDMASNALPVPPPLEIHDSNAADKWRKFLAAWENYALATD